MVFSGILVDKMLGKVELLDIFLITGTPLIQLKIENPYNIIMARSNRASLQQQQ